jgi:hypothetical protein
MPSRTSPRIAPAKHPNAPQSAKKRGLGRVVGQFIYKSPDCKEIAFAPAAPECVSRRAGVGECGGLEGERGGGRLNSEGSRMNEEFHAGPGRKFPADLRSQ